VTRLANLDANKVPLDEYCQYSEPRGKCPFWEDCLSDKCVPEKNSVFAYLDGSRGLPSPSGLKVKPYELVNEGIVDALALERENLSEKQQIQYDVFKEGKIYIDINKLEKGFERLAYPLYYLDFETMNTPLPRYRGEKPYQQSVFQFSLHIETSKGKIENHVAYLAPNHADYRGKIAKLLADHIPDDGGSVIVYNQSFESGRLKELANLFPEYDTKLLNIQSRIFDLMYLTRGSTKFYKSIGLPESNAEGIVFYHEDLQRSFSIKKVLPVLVPSLTYSSLDEVHDGVEVQIAYMKLPTLKGEEYQNIYKNMLEYCKQDTLAMFKILNALQDLI
jgi:hypothetical protein